VSALEPLSASRSRVSFDILIVVVFNYSHYTMHNDYIYRNIPKVFNKMYRSRTDSESEILRVLLNADHAVRYRKIQGYGLKDSDFDDKPNCSRRIFNHRKKELLNSYYIRKLKQSDGRSTYYQITPLGIIHLCKSVNDLKEIPFTRIFDVLKFYYNKGKRADEKSYIDKLKNSWDVLEKVFGKNWFVEPLNEITKTIELESNPDHYDIHLYYELSHGLKVLINSFWISKDEIRMKAPSKEPEDFLYFSDVVDNEKMYSLISKFIIKAFLHYFVYENTTEREMLSILESELPEKKKFKNYQEEFRKFPESMLGVADEFTIELHNSIEMQIHPLKTVSNEIYYRFRMDWEKRPHYTMNRYGIHLRSTEKIKNDQRSRKLIARIRLH